jgi:hypothetical protein
MKIIQNDNFNAGTVHLILFNTLEEHHATDTTHILLIGLSVQILDQAIKFYGDVLPVIMEPTVIIEDDSDIVDIIGRFWQRLGACASRT